MLQQFDERNRDLIVNVGGRLVHRDEAGVSPFDSLVQGGDGVWEGLRLYDGRIFRLTEHLDRLADSAKAIAMLAVHGMDGTPLHRFKVPVEAPRGLPIVCIPTTAGTGSEVTKVSIVIDSDSGEKMLIAGAGLLPDAALVDYEVRAAACP